MLNGSRPRPAVIDISIKLYNRIKLLFKPRGLELYPIPHMSVEDPHIEKEILITRALAKEVCEIKIYSSDHFKGNYYIQVSTTKGYLCSLRATSADDARVYRDNLIRFFNSVIQRTPIVLTIPNSYLEELSAENSLVRAA